MLFREIDNFLWNSMEPYLPPQKPHTGRPRVNMRKLMNGIFYVVMTVVRGKTFPGNMDLSQQFIDFIYICVNMHLS